MKPNGGNRDSIRTSYAAASIGASCAMAYHTWRAEPYLTSTVTEPRLKWFRREGFSHNLDASGHRIWVSMVGWGLGLVG